MSNKELELRNKELELPWAAVLDIVSIDVDAYNQGLDDAIAIIKRMDKRKGGTVTAAATERPAPRTWRIAPNVWLEEALPLVGETERWETGITGSHPCRICLAKLTDGQWRATVASSAGLSVDPWLALTEAQANAVDFLTWSRSRIDRLDFEWAHEEHKP